MKVRDKRVARIQTQKACREAQFQRQLKLAFQNMSGREFRAEAKKGFLSFAFFPKGEMDMHHIDSRQRELLRHLSQEILFYGSSKLQIWEHLKNSYIHGGDAIVGIRLFYAFKQGEFRKIMEVVVWDNGKGIKDLRKAVSNGWSSKKGNDGIHHCGAGLGMDWIIAPPRETPIESVTGLEMDWINGFPRETPAGPLLIETGLPVVHLADEIVVESGYQVAFRKHKTDSHHFKRSRIAVPGTRITTRFWL